jgi:fructose-1,6-bisphosphatase/inositol monophosphatase family enzyme
MFGSADLDLDLDLDLVAEGRTDACVTFANKPSDSAAGVFTCTGVWRSRQGERSDHKTSSKETVDVTSGLTTALNHFLQKTRSYNF